MRRRIERLGLAMVAMAALGAVMASGAAANFDAHNSSVTIHGEQPTENQFEYTFESGSTSCEVAQFHSLSEPTVTGTQSFPVDKGDGWHTSETITGETILEGCANSLLGAMNFKMNDCDSELKANGAIVNGTRTGTKQIICHAGGKIEIVRAEGTNPCTITIGEQTVGGVTYHNENEATGDKAIIVTTNITGIKYTQDGVFCPGNGFQSEKTFENGTWTGEFTLEGTNEVGDQVPLQVT
ncbi:MAG TPA: hypothetical protein VFG66_07900 [Gemmatimonadales bacterium]|nr:hypothetical protein [Gemmatimonadales bacterium]